MNNSQSLSKTIDSFFFPTILERFSEDEKVRARVILSVLLFSSISVAISSFAMLCLSLLLVRNLWIGVYFSGFVAVGMAVTALMFRKRGHILMAANIFAILIFSSIGAAFVVTGGIHSPVGFMLLAVPVSIFMVAGRRSGLLWSLLTLIFYLLVFFLQKNGIEFFQIMRDQNREVVTTSLWYFSGVIIIGFLAAYERIVDGLKKDIQAQKSKFHDEVIYDPLTKFFNRESFQEKFEEALHTVSSTGGRLAILRVDIKNLKGIIGQFGYDKGDELIVKIAHICRNAVGLEGFCGRFGSGELCILIPQVRDRGQVISLISRIKKKSGDYIPLEDGIKIPVRLSIGGVFAPDFSISSRSLLRGVQDALVESESLKESFVLR